jgi:hypothetical protein
MEKTTEARTAGAARYAALIVEKNIDWLMDALMRCAITNNYGSHDEQIAVLRAEIARRVA